MPRKPLYIEPPRPFIPKLPLKILEFKWVGMGKGETATDLHVVDDLGRTLRIYPGGRDTDLARNRGAARRYAENFEPYGNAAKSEPLSRPNGKNL